LASREILQNLPRCLVGVSRPWHRLTAWLERHKLADQILATVNELLAAQGLLLKAGTAVDATLIAAPSAQPSCSGCP
jgi:hypothetical protein